MASQIIIERGGKMITAKHFTYKGISSEMYGLEIVSFNGDENVVESTTYSSKISLLNVPSSKRVTRGGISTDDPPIIEFSIVSQEEFDANSRSRIIAWLLSDQLFSPIKFIESDLLYYTCYGTFTSVTSLYVNGHCQGFKVTMQCDSWYARGIPTNVIASSGTSTVTIMNNSAIFNDYVYPTVTFAGSSIEIINTTDDATRTFAFTGLSESEIMTVDCETKIMKSLTGGPKLSYFNKNWLRLKPGLNTLSITTTGSVSITCPTYILIGI